MIAPILISIFQNKIARQILGVLLLLVIIGGGIAYLTYRAEKAEKKAKEAQAEANRLQRKNEGQEILINTANIAVEIERQKEVANRQAENTNVSVNRANEIRNANFSNTSLDVANKARCQAYPGRCQGR